MAKRLRLLGEVRGLITVPDAIAARFQSRAARGLSAVAMLVAIIGYMATNILALGLVIDAIFGTGLTGAVDRDGDRWRTRSRRDPGRR
jgi:Na+/proline symporter